MKRYDENFIKMVREIRIQKKLSYARLSQRYNIHSSTIRNWCCDIKSIGSKSDILLLYNEEKRTNIKNSENSIVPKLEAISKENAKFLAGLLYGCEGSKYPASNCMAFANSDPKLVVTFLHLRRKAFKLEKKKFIVHLQIHSTQKFGDLRKKWSNLLSIPEDQFLKPTVTSPKGKKHRNNYFGTCTLRYQDYRIQLKLPRPYGREILIMRFVGAEIPPKRKMSLHPAILRSGNSAEARIKTARYF